MRNAIRWSGARIAAVGVVVVLLAAWGSSDGGERRGQPEEGTAQDGWIDSVPLLTIGADPDDPLHRVVGAVLVGDTLIIAQSSLGNGGQRHRSPPPFSRSSSAGVIGDGYYILDNKVAMIPVVDTAGTLVREIGPDTPPEPVRISREDRGRLSGFDDIDADDLPQFYPFYSRSSVVSGAFWVLDYLDRERDRRMEWSVYPYEGELLGRVTAEERLKILAVDGDVAIVVHYGGWDVETVQLRRIVKGGTSR